MKDAFGAGLLDERDRLLERFLSPFHVFLFYGHSHFFDGRFHQGLNVKISNPSFFILFGPFNGRWMTCQVNSSSLHAFAASAGTGKSLFLKEKKLIVN